MAVDLTVGINTYCTIEQATDYINSHFSENSPEYKAWFNEEVSDDEKARALIRSTAALHNLKYTGAKLKRGQALDFPRRKVVMPGMYMIPMTPQNYDYRLVDGGFGDNGLQAAMEAQIENAVVMLAIGQCSAVQTKKRQLSGLRSKRADDISENYDNNASVMFDVQTGLYAKEMVEAKLKAWLTSAVYTV